MIIESEKPAIATSWKSFFFDTNLCWGLIESKEAWAKMVRNYPYRNIYSVRLSIHNLNPESPSYGLYCEHQGELLADFFDLSFTTQTRLMLLKLY
jgi:hypothetical protein